MKRLFAFLPTALLAVAVVAVAPDGAQGQKKSKPAIVAVVDVQTIFRDSLAMKGVREQIEQHRKKFRAEITAQEKKLRASGQKLEKQRTVLSKEAFNKKGRVLQEKVAAVQRQFAKRRSQLDQAFRIAGDKFKDMMVAVVKEIADEDGLQLVLAKSQVLHVSSQFEITDKALLRLNKRLPKLNVKVSEK